MKEIWIGNEEIKLFTFADGTIIYRENSKGATSLQKKKSIRGNKFSKLQDTKLIYRNLLHYYNYKVAELEVKNNSICSCIKKNKVLRNKPKEVKDVYSEICKTLMKEIENNTN